jgi:hypothetical protein
MKGLSNVGRYRKSMTNTSIVTAYNNKSKKLVRSSTVAPMTKKKKKKSKFGRIRTTEAWAVEFINVLANQ